MKPSLYQVLNVPENADSDRIKRGAQTKIDHIKAAVQDKDFMFLGVNNDASPEEFNEAAKQRIKKIKEAYIILSNPKTRDSYDKKWAKENPDQTPKELPKPESVAPPLVEPEPVVPSRPAPEEPDGMQVAAGLAIIVIILGLVLYPFIFPGPLGVRPSKAYEVPKQLAAKWEGHEKSRGSDIYAVAISSDGKWVASGTSENDPVQVRDIKTGKIVQRFNAQEIQMIRYHPTQPILAVGTSSHDLILWNYEADSFEAVEHQNYSNLNDYTGISDVVFTADGQKLASVSWNGSIMVWDLEKNRAIWNSQGAETASQAGHRSDVSGAAFSPDGKILVTSGYDKTVRVWDAETGIEKYVFDDPKDEIWTVDYSDDGRWIAAGANNNTFYIWNAENYQLHKEIRGHKSSVSKLIFMPNSEVLITASDDRLIRYWEISTGGLIATLRGHRSIVYGLSLTPDGKTLVSGGADDILFVWK